ncbi:cyclopropane-fatty-acyl-phospholipid synthase [Tistlia consotensis]|uniref:Cyclopropane-fatty-acyl-phospholipid synthase n=1 Tax=Tistlia consotensis USBA 355 TaxID=560819 RepID=A0A1Y6BB39_9PROT|nr:cyclopropane-fatty-acyl-phospholipid synthase family protein [Tistlia consotensis]SMF00525.1 cyclopropane-fatty-acyl-phospholipid synthase [Tistlia consotensis USBA 355]SNR75727.1 cyclopropane-fatty-acyl-phospholipid synthase [Tistlia consotensis]
MLLHSLFAHMIRTGSLSVIDARGQRRDYGDGAEPRAVVKLHRTDLEWKLAVNPAVRLGEAYMDGLLTIEEGDLYSLLDVMAHNYHRLEEHWLVKAGNWLLRQGRRVKQYNPIGRAQKNVAHHYDLSGRLYDLFLDPDRQYSCAYFATPDTDLESAQLAKKRHLAAKLRLAEPGLTALDIGSGWGGMALYLAQVADADVTGVTLSVEQYKLSQARAAEAQLQDHCRFELVDYRQKNGPFDRIVSVGMFEHVGKANYDEYFGKVRKLLAEDGVAVIHSIGRFDEPSPINPFIRKYIFPGADVPALSEVMTSVEKSGLLVTDIEILRLHYAETLKNWNARFQANRKAIAELYDERFCRMWEMYLVGCELGFRRQGLMVFQIQLTRRLDAIPLTRDYMVEEEKRLAELEQERFSVPYLDSRHATAAE